MKHLDRSALALEIDRLTQSLGLRVTPQQAQDMALHVARVLEANESFNLTSITEPADAVRLLVVDSLTAMPEVDDAPAGNLVDIGAGAGFPGIPLAIVSGRHVRLVESVGKKTRFLEEVAGELAVSASVSVSCARAEELATIERECYAVATARALSGLPSLVELAAPLLFSGGRLVALKGALTSEELGRGDSAASVVGLTRVAFRQLRLPEAGESRSIVVYERTGASSIALPRRVGLAQRKPLS